MIFSTIPLTKGYISYTSRNNNALTTADKLALCNFFLLSFCFCWLETIYQKCITKHKIWADCPSSNCLCNLWNIYSEVLSFFLSHILILLFHYYRKNKRKCHAVNSDFFFLSLEFRAWWHFQETRMSVRHNQ